jgi:hypothetical protein
MKSGLMAVALAVGVLSLASTALQAAAQDNKAIVDMLFEEKHIVNVPVGTKLVYTFERKPSDPAKLGIAYKDDITVTVEADAPNNKKNVMLQIYSGERARDPHRITDMDGNPILIVYLDNAVAHFRDLAGGDRAYLKNTFSSQIAKSAKLDAVKIVYNGQEVDGHRVTVSPYTNDPARAKMRGYEGATFTIVVSEKIPGHFAQMVSNYTNSSKEQPVLQETTTLKGVEGVK